MKFTDKLVEFFGTDKLLHMFLGGWIVSMTTLFGWWGILIGFIFVNIISFVKEKFLDEFFETKDIIAANIGMIISVIVYVVERYLILH